MGPQTREAASTVWVLSDAVAVEPADIGMSGKMDRGDRGAAVVGHPDQGVVGPVKRMPDPRSVRDRRRPAGGQVDDECATRRRIVAYGRAWRRGCRSRRRGRLLPASCRREDIVSSSAPLVLASSSGQFANALLI